METVNDRFRMFFESLDMDNKVFADTIQATDKEVSNWKGHVKIPLERLKVILLKYRNLDAFWLITGVGENKFISTGHQKYNPASTPMISVNDSPTSPFEYDCGHERCQIEKRHLLKDISRLEQNLNDMRRKETRCAQGELEGGVEKPGKAV
jgi:hypothetical protein